MNSPVEQFSHLVSLPCRQCGATVTKQKRAIGRWRGYCAACERVSLSCRVCGTVIRKRRDQVAAWKGHCRHCAQIHRRSGLTGGERNKASRERRRVPVTCSECPHTWRKNPDALKAWDGRCRSCAYKARFADPAYGARQAENARAQVLAQGGIPNRKVFTPERVRGAANHNWKGGVYPAHKAFRKTKAYQEWRGAVFARDDYTCMACGKRGVYLHAHHVVEFAERPDLRLDPMNGLTLCH